MRMRRGFCLLLAPALIASLALVATGSAEATSPVQSVRQVSTAAGAVAGKSAARTAHPRAKKKAYWPTSGPLFNNPLGPLQGRWTIFNKIKRSIENTPKRGTIRIMSWNVMSMSAVNTLIAASKRGVRVRVLMDIKNSTELPNPSWVKLRSGLRASNGKRAAGRRSIAKVCHGSCRNNGGDAHSKYFLFSQVGERKRVIEEGSANLTAAAAINQWNDLYTTAGRTKMYQFYVDVFNQMWQDKPVKNPYVTGTFGNIEVAFFPFRGKFATEDPVLGRLQQVKCTGATKKYGNSRGRTIVRAAPDVLRGKRGMAIAQQLKTLYNQGCDVRLVYTVMGKDVFHYLKARTGRGPLPIRHLVQDINGDGEFDNYFHLKALTVNGSYGKSTTTRFVLQGSSNWSDYAAASDENIEIITASIPTLKYQKFITYWFDHPPVSVPLMPTVRRSQVDPYAHVDMD